MLHEDVKQHSLDRLADSDMVDLFRHIDRLYRQRRGPRELLPAVAKATGSTVYLAEPGNKGWDLLSKLGCSRSVWLARFRGARAALQTASGHHVMLAPVGDRSPRPVLTAVRSADEGAWPAEMLGTFAAVATQAALLLHRVHLIEREDAHRRRRRHARFNMLQALMAGHLQAARWLATPEEAAWVGTGQVAMAIVACAPEQRESLVQLCERVLPCCLVVPCPYDPSHILITACAVDRAGRDLATSLRAVLHDQPYHGAGVSTPQSWHRITRAYVSARHALTECPGGTVAAHTGPVDLASALHGVPGSARWAQRVLAPAVTTAPDARRAQRTQLALSAGVPRAALRIGTDRSNLRRDLVTVMGQLRLDHRELGHRAVAELAFQLASGDSDEGPEVGVHDLLVTAEARAWSAGILLPLAEASAPPGGWLGPHRAQEVDGQEGIVLVALFLRAGCSISASSRELGLSSPSTRHRLSKAATALGLPIDDPRSNAPHVAVMALTIAGHLPRHLLPDLPHRSEHR